MKSKKTLLSFLALSSLMLVGCDPKESATETGGGTTGTSESTGTSEEPVDYNSITNKSLVIASPAAHQPFVQGKVEAWLQEKGLEGFTVTMYDLGEDKAKEVTDWTSAGSPDIYGFASDQIGSLYSKGALSSVPRAYSAKMDTDMGETNASAGYLGEGCYAYPYAGDNGYFLYYNKSLINENQIGSVETLIDACTAQNLKFGYALDSGSEFFSIGTFMTFGARYEVTLNDDGSFASATSNFGSAAGVKGGKAVQWLANNAGVEITNGGARNLAPTAANGFGAVVEGSWNYSTFEEAVGAENLGVAKLPTITIDGDTKNFASFLGYKLYGVNPTKSSEDTARLALLHEIANYLVSEDVQQDRFKELNVIPTNQAVRNTDAVKNNPLATVLADQAQYSVPQTIVPSNIWSGATAAVESLKDATADVQSVMDQYDDTIEASKAY